MKIAVVGNLVNNGYIITKTLRALGYEADLFITCKKNKIHDTQNPKLYDNLSENPSWVKIFNTSGGLFSLLWGRRALRKYDLVIAITLSPAYVQFCHSNFISIATGSDLRDFVFEKGFYNKLLRRAYFKNRHLFYLNPDHINAIYKLHLEDRSSFLPYPIEVDQLRQNYTSCDKLTSVFWPSTWSFRLKGADKFVVACQRLFDQGKNFNLKIIDFSESFDVNEQEKNFVLDFAKKYSDKVTIAPRIKNKEDFVAECAKHDLIIDQFSLGSYGGLAVEAMAAGRAVLTYLNPDYFSLFDGQKPPFFNAYTVEQIMDHLSNFKWSELDAQNSYQWVKRWHGEKEVITRMLKTINVI